KGSLTLFKYDLTNAEKDGVWDSSYVSTGVYDENVNKTLGDAIRAGDSDNSSDLGNDDVSYGYAVKGVEFTYLKVAEIVQFTESEKDGVTYNHVEVLYGIDKNIGADLLNALGLPKGAERYTNADQLDNTKYFYQSDVLIDALELALQTNSTNVKNALERYIAANGGTAMPLTDSYGKSQANDLDLGLYLVIETKVPEMVTSTCNPFFVSIPMTSVNGTNATDGGTRWIYDVTIYPKNLTGIPSLEKTLRENVDDTGKHEGTADDITDGYAHTGTASDGDVIDYQLISTLPSITSESTYLTEYTFIDTLSAGLSYNKKDIIIEFFSDAACTDLLDSWDESDGMFTATYSTTNANESVMTIKMTAAGLQEINTNKRVYTGASMVNSGYSDCTIRITYKATMHSDDSVIYGDSGNPNEVVLLWKRSSQDYYDTLVDDAHVFTYAMELTKLFSDGNGNFENVEFIMQNDSDGYYVKAELNKEEGIYYVVDHVADEKDATHFVPVIPQPAPKAVEPEYKVIVKGLEDDSYTITEVRTDDGYTLLKDNIKIVISQTETEKLCNIYASDVLGLVQNDPRYATIINDTGDLKNMPQKHLEHHLLTASATVDGNKVNMLEDDGSINASVPLKVVNTRGFDLPQTGDHGTWMFSVI
ncbi:MAG: isopeptide-forming domain-containing fimbrial protein, partial [Oscillospiraceae bacterium]|nr:isopeptide-forming domain-containing fimbrial protein [Oscillospiraceae bacterium]